ncbi:MAG: MBL fold metallo-hydrolase [Promethearchaeota archaeon]|nr:MAG: MBL fold metallo-hydrolase [Candidatus Lokiarchaeota archaeon]
MILKRLIVGPLGTNCYIFGKNDAVIIDPGGDSKEIINEIDKLDINPIAILLTHGHFDHTMKVGRISRHFKIPLMFNKNEYDSGIFTQKKADKWLNEGDSIQIDDMTLKVLETPGHSPGSLCFYSNDVKTLNSNNIDGIIFTGDLLFRRSIGRTDINGGDMRLLFESIKNKIMNNPNITDNFMVFPGHMGITSVGEEREHNIFKNYFL